MSLCVTGSARGRFAQHTPRHPSPAADTRSLDGCEKEGRDDCEESDIASLPRDSAGDSF